MRVKRVLGEYESIFPNLYSSLQAAMLPLVSRGSAQGLSGFEDAKNAILGNAKAAGQENDSDPEQEADAPTCGLKNGDCSKQK